jgi:hypothetical protein
VILDFAEMPKRNGGWVRSFFEEVGTEPVYALMGSSGNKVIPSILR